MTVAANGEPVAGGNGVNFPASDNNGVREETGLARSRFVIMPESDRRSPPFVSVLLRGRIWVKRGKFAPRRVSFAGGDGGNLSAPRLAIARSSNID